MCYISATETIAVVSSNRDNLNASHRKVNSKKARLQYLDCFTSPGYILPDHPLRPGHHYSHKVGGKSPDKLMEKVSVGSVCNHGHGQIVFRSSADLISNLQTVLFSFCSLGKIDFVLKSPAFLAKGSIDHNTLQLNRKHSSQPPVATNKDVITQTFQLLIYAGVGFLAEETAD